MKSHQMNHQHKDSHGHPARMEEVVATIVTPGFDPRALAISPDGKSLYATGRNNFWVFDTEHREVIHKFAPAQTNYSGLVMAPDGTRVYVVRDKQVDVIDTASHTVITSFPDLPVARNLTITPDGNRLLATFGTRPGLERDRHVAAIDLQTGQRRWTIDLNYAGPLALTADGTRAFVTQANGGPDEGVIVLDTGTGQTIGAWSDLGSTFGIALSSDGAYACATRNGYEVKVIDTHHDTVKVVPMATRTHDVAVLPGTHIAYVTQGEPLETRKSGVGVVDLASGTVLRNIDNGNFAYPVGIVIAPNGTRAYVASLYNNRIMEIAL